MSRNYPLHLPYLLLIFLLSLSLGLPPAKAQSQFEGLEFPYTDEDQYGLNETFYWKRFFKSLITWRKPDCNRNNLPGVARKLANFGLYERDGAIYLDSAYFYLTREALSRNNEYFVVDVIQEAQYPCGNSNKINQRLESRGYLLPPVFESDIKKAKGDLLVGCLPVNPENEIFFNVYIKKKRNCQVCCCCCIYPLIVCIKTLEEKLDTLLISYQQPWYKKPEARFSPNPDAIKLEFKIPFEKGITEVDPAEIHRMDSLLPPDSKIKELDIQAFASVEGTEEANQRIHESRGENIKHLFDNRLAKGYKYSLSTTISWDNFREQVKETPWDSLSAKSNDEIRNLLLNTPLADSLEPLLSQGRYAEVSLTLSQLKPEDYPEYVLMKYEKSLSKRDVESALAHLNHLIHSVMDLNRVAEIEIPFEEKYVDLISNLFGRPYTQDQLVDNEQLTLYENLSALDKNNAVALFNLTVCKFNNMLEQKIKGYNFQTSYEALTPYIENVKTHPGIPAEFKRELLAKWQMISLELNKVGFSKKRASNRELVKIFSKPEEALYVANRLYRGKRFIEGAEFLTLWFQLYGDELKKEVNHEFATKLITLHILHGTQAFYDEKELQHVLFEAYQINSGYFCKLFKIGVFNRTWFEIRAIKRFYCNTCGKES